MCLGRPTETLANSNCCIWVHSSLHATTVSAHFHTHTHSHRLKTTLNGWHKHNTPYYTYEKCVYVCIMSKWSLSRSRLQGARYLKWIRVAPCVRVYVAIIFPPSTHLNTLIHTHSHTHTHVTTLLWCISFLCAIFATHWISERWAWTCVYCVPGSLCMCDRVWRALRTPWSLQSRKECSGEVFMYKYHWRLEVQHQ